MPENLHIGEMLIGRDCPTFIIAEAGVNHNGSIDLAKELIAKAAECGADCIKFQTFKADKIVLRDTEKAEYQKKNTGSQESQFKMLQNLEMPTAWYPELIEECRRHNLIFLSTPYDTSDIAFLEEFNLPAYKVASAWAVEPVFLKALAKTMKPILLSTGMCTGAEVYEAVQTIRECGNNKIILLQCTTNYPSRNEDCNLMAMKNMGKSLNVLTGYSDHTQGLAAATLSVGLGASVIERHFTLDKSFPGPDHSSSSDPEEFAQLVVAVKESEKILGNGIKTPCAAEIINKKAMRRSIVAACDIPKGTRISNEHIAYKRPATGVSPKHAEHMIGRISAKDIAKDSFLYFNDLSVR